MTLTNQSKEELWIKYRRYKFKENSDLQEILLPNDIFIRFKELKNCGKHRAFGFALYTFSKFAIMTNHLHSMTMIQQLWGYSSSTRTLQPIVKKGGILDEAGLTETIIQGLDSRERLFLDTKSTKIYFKRPVYDVDTSKGKFFRVFVEPMLACMINAKELGVMAFYVYAFICFKAQTKAFGTNNLYTMTPIATKFISEGLGISVTTVKSILNKLEEFGLILRIKTPVTKIQDYNLDDANKILPLTECPKCFPPIPEQATVSKPMSIPKPKLTKPTQRTNIKQNVFNRHSPAIRSEEDKEANQKMLLYMEVKRVKGQQSLTTESLDKIIARFVGKISTQDLNELKEEYKRLCS